MLPPDLDNGVYSYAAWDRVHDRFQAMASGEVPVGKCGNRTCRVGKVSQGEVGVGEVKALIRLPAPPLGYRFLPLSYNFNML